MIHAIVIQRIPYFSSTYVYEADCICGRYYSGKSTSDMHAWMSGQAHISAKKGTE